MLSVFDKGEAAPCPPSFNLAEYVLAQVPVQRDKPALCIVSTGDAYALSFGQLHDAVRRKAGGLQAMGLQPGARVILRLGNSVEFPLAFLSCIWAGLIPVPTSAQLTTAEVSALCQLISPQLIVASEGVSLPDPIPCPVLDDEAFSQLAKSDPATPCRGNPNRLAYIVFTSGTSGKPQAVMHAHRAIWARRMMFDGWYGLGSTDRIMHAGAFNWTYTLGTGLLDPWAVGATALIPNPGTDVSSFPSLLAKHAATLFAAAPGVYRQMLRHKFPPLPELRHALSAGEALPDVTREAWKRTTGTEIYEAFGMSECSTFISGSPKKPAPTGGCGYPQSGRRIAILDENNEPVPRGTPGVLAVGATDQGLTLGYFAAPGATQQRFTPDRDWFRTGDLAKMAGDDAITYLGRDDDMMNAGGYRVSPVEVEAVLAKHPMINEVACAEVSVGKATTVIAAFYTSKEARPKEAFEDFASTRLAGYKRPRIYIHADELPRSANGKLLRKALRCQYEAENDKS